MIAVVNAKGQYALTPDGLDIATFPTRYAAMKYAATLLPETAEDERPLRSRNLARMELTHRGP